MLDLNSSRFLGAHAMIIGGYGQLVNGLATTPTALNIRYNQRISKISYNRHNRGEGSKIDERPVTIICDNGEEVEADAVVLTVSLGVLKCGTISFDPELPSQKKGAISRLGFGLLNKVNLWGHAANIRWCWFMITRSGRRRLISWDACGLHERETLMYRRHMKTVGEGFT
jgi:Flavin containing amine oxidoreductase